MITFFSRYNIIKSPFVLFLEFQCLQKNLKELFVCSSKKSFREIVPLFFDVLTVNGRRTKLLRITQKLVPISNSVTPNDYEFYDISEDSFKKTNPMFKLFTLVRTAITKFDGAITI